MTLNSPFRLVCAPSAASVQRQTFSLFRRQFALESVPQSAILELFADTRYRVWVNGAWVGAGPSRFHPSEPQFDEIEIAPFLRAGANEIRVETQFRGVSSFQARPGKPAFGARGKIGAVSLETPGDWRVKISCARALHAPPFSFAQGPVEILDFAVLENEWRDESGWQTPAPAESGFFGELSPRRVPPISGEIAQNAALLSRFAPQTDESRLVFTRDFGATPDAIPGIQTTKRRFFVAVFLTCEAAIETEIGLFWGRNFLNGEPIALENAAPGFSRQSGTVRLQKGENLLFCGVDLLQNDAGFAFAWPREAANLGEVWCSEATASDESGEFAAPANRQGWREVWQARMTPLAQWPCSDFPSREVAFDRLDATSVCGETTGARVEVFDFGGEVLGFLRAQIECEAPTTLDLTLDEALLPSGLVRLYTTNPFIHGTDRFVLPPGRHEIETFHPRGGRFLQLTARSEAPVTLRNIGVRDATLPILDEGDFSCSDPFLNWVFETGKATTQACLPDVWVDCPWREQGAYIGDTLVEFHATRALSSDFSVMRRALELWAQCQNEDGQLPACAPAWYRLPHCDFSLKYILAARDYGAASGDWEFVATLWPTIRKIWDSPLWETGKNGLWNATKAQRLFIDWGVLHAEREGAGNGVLNALRFGALEATAQILRAQGRDASEFEAQIEPLKTAFSRVLWQEERGHFAAFEGAAQSSKAHHANALALRFELCSAAQETAILGNLRAARDLMRTPGNLGAHDGHLELYFWHYVLEAFCARGWHDEALETVRALYTPLREKGAATFWETLYHGWRDDFSLCHAWSCAPVWFLSRSILGLHPAPNDPDRFVFAPHTSNLEWARGVVPHSRGPIRVSWSQEQGEFRCDIQAPDGVTIER